MSARAAVRTSSFPVVAVWLAVLVATAACNRAATSASTEPAWWSKLPASGKNNVWFEHPGADTVFVFVHGILGDSRETWLYRDASDASRHRYWPALMLTDPRIRRADVFLGGYHTAVDSGRFDIPKAADELWRALNRQIEAPGRGFVAPLMTRPVIVFVAHSLGGIIARYVLYHHREDFRDKIVGLVLIASPSYGSNIANTLSLLTKAYHNRAAQQLEWDNDLLRQLDDNFKDLLAARMIPNLIGIEALEHHFVLHHKWWPSERVVVNEQSAARYFASGKLLRQTDHLSIAKPSALDHPVHELLVDFSTRDLGGLRVRLGHERLDGLMAQIARVRGEYEAVRKYGAVAARAVADRAEPLGSQLLALLDEFLRPAGRVAKYANVASAYVMAASVARTAETRIRLATTAIEHGRTALRLAAEIPLTGDAASEWVIRSRVRDFANYIVAAAHAIRLRAGAPSTLRDVTDAWNGIDEQYRRDYPAAQEPDLGWAIAQARRR